MAYDYNQIFNDIPDYEKMPPQFRAEPQTTVPEENQPNKIVESIFASAAPPPPTYDEAAQKRKEQIAKLNTAGRGFTVLGDILSLSTGANVQQRQPDRVTPAMFQSYQDYVSDYDKRIDQYNYQKYRDELARKQLLLQDSYRQEDISRDEAWKEKGFQQRQDYQDSMEQRYIDDQGLRREQFEYGKETTDDDFQNSLEKMRRQHDYTMKEIEARTDYYNPKGSEKAVQIQLASGETRSYTPAQISYLRDQALKNIDLVAKEHKHLFDEKEGAYDPKTGSYPIIRTLSKTATDDDVIRAYIDLMERRQEPKKSIFFDPPQHHVQVPLRHDATQTAQPDTTSNQQPAMIDYSKLIY